MSRARAVSVVSSSLSRRLVAGAVLGALSAFGLGGGGGVSGGAGFCADTGPNGPPGAEFCLPTDPAAWRFVSSASPEAPAPMRALAERTGIAWSAVWDLVLEVPYLAFPRGICRLGALEPSSASDAVASAAAAFLERHRDVFGVGPEGLTDLEVYPFDDGYHLTASQRHAGLPVRGAIFRLRVNGDGTAHVSDAVRILGYLFLGESEVGCPDALDANDDGAIDLTDPIRLLGHLFLGQPPLPEPFESCGPDPTPHDNMGCWESPCPPLSL